MSLPQDKRHLPFGGTSAIQDKNAIQFISSIQITNALWDVKIISYFLKEYVQWIHSSKNNHINGLDQFVHAVYSNGTSQAFDMFYTNNRTRRFRCFRGEYTHHQLAWRNNWPDWQFIEDAPLNQNDAVVISLPFSDTGNKHNEMESLLANCSTMNIPVLVDCAFFGICSGIDFNFEHPCITDVVFSLSKTFPVAHARIGMRLTRKDDDDIMHFLSKINYNNRIGAKIGYELIKKFSPDYIYNKYHSQQNKLCDQHDVLPSASVTFGIDQKNQYSEYNRGCDTNRLSFHNHYE